MSFPMIFITGTDGSGKTTLAHLLKAYFENNGTKVKVVWSRYNNYFSKPLLAVARLTGHNYYESKNGTIFGYHDFQSLPLLSRLYVMLQCLDVNIATWKNILRQKEPDTALVCERGPWDTIADVMLDTGDDYLHEKAIGKLFVENVMEQSKVIYISRSYENIILKRPELAHDRSLMRKIEIYELLSEKFDWHLVDNNGSLKKTEESMIRAIHSGNM